MAGSSRQPFRRPGELSRGNAERIGGGGEIRLVRGEEIEHRTEHSRIGESGAERGGCEPGQVEQTLGPAFAGKEPAERTEGKSLRIGGG